MGNVSYELRLPIEWTVVHQLYIFLYKGLGFHEKLSYEEITDENLDWQVK